MGYKIPNGKMINLPLGEYFPPPPMVSRTGMESDVHDGCFSLWVHSDDHTKEELKEFMSSDLKVGVGFAFGLIVFYLKIGDWDWIDSFYSHMFTCLVHKMIDNPTMDFVKEGFEGIDKCTVYINFINTNTNILEAKRTIEVDRPFIDFVLDKMEKQLLLVEEWGDGMSEEEFTLIHDSYLSTFSENPVLYKVGKMQHMCES